VPKAFEFAESCSKTTRFPLASFKNGWVLWSHFSNKNCSSETYFPNLKTGEIAPCRFSIAPGATLTNCYPTGANYLTLPVLKSFLQIPKLLALNS
jgi:hypothetical protein